MELDTDIIIIGAGMSGLGLAVQLVQQYGHRNFELIERSNRIGGAWRANSYPGCGVDIIAHFYAYSFFPNPNWSRKYPLQPEILAYVDGVAAQYDIEKHTRFRSSVTSAHWDEVSATWLVKIENLETLETYERRCKVLISAVGLFSHPKECDISGASSFDGRMFHTAEWDHSFDWKGKEVVVVGNGCSATQVVPAISGGGPDGPAVKKVTQFARQSQWIFERPNPEYSSSFKWAMRWVPLAQRTYRFAQHCVSELDFMSFPAESGASMRKMYANAQKDYVQRVAPARYHEFLTPKTTEVACQRRILDSGYLESLHQDNVELVYEDPIEEIVKEGVRTASDRIVKADAIVLANGFRVQQPLLTMDLQGEGGISLAEHWDSVSQGSASAYLGTCVAGFPNLFIMMGPNTVSGHGSVTYITECQINFTLRLIRPILSTLAAARKSRHIPAVKLFPGRKADAVRVKPEAERADIDTVQGKLQQLVWASGCTSWALDPRNRRNTAMYPDFQFKFRLRSILIPRGDFEYSMSKEPAGAVSTPEKLLRHGSRQSISKGVAIVTQVVRQRVSVDKME